MATKGQTVDVFERVEVSVPPYRDALKPRDVGRGILATHRNTRRLFRDALVLLENGRYPGAVGLAILAQEEAAKPQTIGYISTKPTSSALVDEWRRLWRDFEDHAKKNLVTLELHRLLGNFPSDVREELENVDTKDEAESYVRLRERCTYVDCVQGEERWSLPEAVLDREAVLVFFQAIRKALQRIYTAEQVTRLHGTSEAAALVCSPEALQALREWSGTKEAAELSRLDLEEQSEWNAETGAALTRLGGHAGEAEA
jgi:AbiV family abortive infection protein